MAVPHAPHGRRPAGCPAWSCRCRGCRPPGRRRPPAIRRAGPDRDRQCRSGAVAGRRVRGTPRGLRSAPVRFLSPRPVSLSTRSGTGAPRARRGTPSHVRCRARLGVSRTATNLLASEPLARRMRYRWGGAALAGTTADWLSAWTPGQRSRPWGAAWIAFPHRERTERCHPVPNGLAAFCVMHGSPQRRCRRVATPPTRGEGVTMASRKTEPEPFPVRGRPTGYRDRWDSDDGAIIQAQTAEHERLHRRGP